MHLGAEDERVARQKAEDAKKAKEEADKKAKAKAQKEAEDKAKAKADADAKAKADADSGDKEECKDVEPPAGMFPHAPTCKDQKKKTRLCEKRKTKQKNDGFCALTCGVCTPTGGEFLWGT